MFPSRPARAALGAATAVLLLAGCGDSGGLVSAGPTPTASGPTRLWPDQPPASSPAYDYGEAQKEAIKGIRAVGDDIHKVDPVAVVRAEIAAHPEYYGTDGPYHDTARLMSACGAGASGGGRCPVLKAYYRDLTGDGRDDMTLAFRLRPGNQTAVRVYTFEADRLVQVLANDDAVTGVELAGRKVIIRSPAGITGYEYRTQWTWDAEQLGMLLTRDEILRVGASRRPTPPKPSRSSSPSPSESPR
ncbi:hypothetical protein SGFS_043030 [Streptomyces graminofaciens]|uniref:Lipoprotein n=1 Tax=Streptomyces graminofaciens TaxID=68212 RepID=A0ABM8HKS1_9ACTN|nr:hypothetical protein [Streptomyces graminofaciens]BBC33009.1 hypothetical protein SGFS_043030 [Streptomyces graminofaciens]